MTPHEVLHISPQILPHPHTQIPSQARPPLRRRPPASRTAARSTPPRWREPTPNPLVGSTRTHSRTHYPRTQSPPRRFRANPPFSRTHSRTHFCEPTANPLRCFPREPTFREPTFANPLEPTFANPLWREPTANPHGQKPTLARTHCEPTCFANPLPRTHANPLGKWVRESGFEPEPTGGGVGSLHISPLAQRSSPLLKW